MSLSILYHLEIVNYKETSIVVVCHAQLYSVHNRNFFLSQVKPSFRSIISEGEHVVVVVVYFVLSRLFYRAWSANLGLLCMPHPGMGPLV